MADEGHAGLVDLEDRPSPPFSIREIPRGDADVPIHLASVWPEAIPSLFVQGAWPAPERAITIVGTTSPAPTARAWAYRLAGEGASRGWAVVSGLALGIDGAAHRGALDAGGITIGVVADGPDCLFPVQHRALAERMLQSGGTIVSISPPGTRAGRPGLLLRNQITSALGQVVITAQSRAWDGAMATLRHGFRQGRIIAALVPPDDADPVAWRGNDLLLRRRSPWREYERQWVPALPIWPGDDVGAFFAELDQALESGTYLRYPPETPRETQIRLLETIAPYNLSENVGS